MILEVRNICKTLNKRKILSNVTLTLEGGYIYGFVGRNGSGKTMLFRALSGLMKPDSGEVIYDGKQLHKDMTMLPNLGIVLENAGLYTEFSGFKNLKMLAKLRKQIADEEIRQSILRVGLDPEDKRPIRKYSLGMKQRIVLAQAIMEKPDVLMLDEPTNALDENGIEEVRKIILEEKRRGALILLASHNKEDITLLADKVFYIKDGTIMNEAGSDSE